MSLALHGENLLRYLLLLISAVTTFSEANALELTVNVVDKNNNAVNKVVVFVTPKAGVADLPSNNQKLVIDQQGKKFTPYITVMQKGQNVVFSNKDDITHHIYSVSGKNRFEFKLKAGDSKHISDMNAAEEVAMGCNIHDWMSGYILVVDTPYFTKTNTNGSAVFTVKNSGQYDISVWHPQLDTPSHQITQSHSLSTDKKTLTLTLTKPLLPIPKQVGQEEFEFLEEY